MDDRWDDPTIAGDPGGPGIVVNEARWTTLIKIEHNAQKLVDAMESLPDASAQLLGLKALLKPAEPVYVPLVSSGETTGLYDSARPLAECVCQHTAIVLRKAADRLQREAHIAADSVVPDFAMCSAIRSLCDWADQEEKYNA